METRFGRFGFAWVTGALFLLTLAGHWVLGWYAHVSEQELHNAPSLLDPIS
jgi:hypothetical protein